MSLPAAPAATPAARRLGFWAALLTSLLALLAFGLAVTTLPISGPFCQANCVAYPFSDVAAWVPHDYIWMYPALLLQLAALVLLLTLHDVAPAQRRPFTRVAAAFGLMSALLITADYYVQIAVLQPSILRGETEGVALLTQYNPHGVFIALEDLGYFLLGMAFLCAAPLFRGGRGVARALFWLLLLAGATTVLAWPVLYAFYGYGLEYRYEVLSISITWITLAVAGALSALWFARQTSAA